MFWAFVIIGISVWVVPAILSYLDSRKGTRYTVGMFSNNYIDSRTLFVTRFKTMPSIGVITQIDTTKAYALIMDQLEDQIVDAHQVNMFDHNERNCYFTVTIFELAGKRMIELGNGYAEIMHTRSHYQWAMALLQSLAECKIETETVEEKTPTVVGFARSFDMN